MPNLHSNSDNNFLNLNHNVNIEKIKYTIPALHSFSNNKVFCVCCTTGSGATGGASTSLECSSGDSVDFSNDLGPHCVLGDGASFSAGFSCGSGNSASGQAICDTGNSYSSSTEETGS